MNLTPIDLGPVVHGGVVIARRMGGLSVFILNIVNRRLCWWWWLLLLRTPSTLREAQIVVNEFGRLKSQLEPN